MMNLIIDLTYIMYRVGAENLAMILFWIGIA